jgi:hypothetical protein
MRIAALPTRETRSEITRDSNGNIVETVQREQDA